MVPEEVEQTCLHHLGYQFPKDTVHCKDQFSNIKCLLLCGSVSRAKKIMEQFHSTTRTTKTNSKNLCHTDRFVMFCPTPQVLIASHGIGLGSIDCLLQEIYLLLTLSGAEDWFILRLGSSGGINVQPGKLVITRHALNGEFENKLPMYILGKIHKFEAKLSSELSSQLLSFFEKEQQHSSVYGDTLCAQTFYDAQARLDGVNPIYSSLDRKRFLRKCLNRGVVNFEMESLPLAAFAARVNIPAAVVCIVYLDRILADNVNEDKQVLSEFENNAIRLITTFVKQKLRI